MALSVNELKAMGLSGKEIAGYLAASDMDSSNTTALGVGRGSSGHNNSWADAYLYGLGYNSKGGGGGGSSGGSSGSGGGGDSGGGSSSSSSTGGGLTAEQARTALAEYDPAMGALNNRATNGSLSPAEEAARIAADKGAVQRAGQATAEQAVNSRLAYGLSTPFAGAALQEKASANVAIAGQMARNEILKSEEESKIDAQKSLLGVASDRANIQAKVLDPAGTAAASASYDLAVIEERKKKTAAAMAANGTTAYKFPKGVIYGR